VQAGFKAQSVNGFQRFYLPKGTWMIFPNKDVHVEVNISGTTYVKWLDLSSTGGLIISPDGASVRIFNNTATPKTILLIKLEGGMDLTGHY
jgi:hypothetical protein